MSTKKNVLGGKKSTAVSGFKGVSQKGQRFQSSVHIRFNGKTYTKYIGTYSSSKEAYKARCEYIDSLK